MIDNSNQTQESTQGAQESQGTGKTFTQDEVNRIVQDRLAKERSKANASTNDSLAQRVAELDARERRLNAVTKLREAELSDDLVDVINTESDEAIDKAIEIIKKMKGESIKVGTGNPIGVVTKGYEDREDPVRKAMGLR